MRNLIISRHPATVKAITSRYSGIDFDIITGNAIPADVAGNLCIGNLPLHLASLCCVYIAVEFEKFPPRGEEFSAEDMWKQFGMSLRRYAVKQFEVSSPESAKCILENIHDI